MLERAPGWEAVGAGIVLAPNAMRVALVLGIDDGLRARGFLPDITVIADAAGTRLSELDSADVGDRFGGLVALHRAILHEELRGAVGSAQIRLGTTVREVVTDGDQALVVDSSGRAGQLDQGAHRPQRRRRSRPDPEHGPGRGRIGQIGQWEHPVACWVRGAVMKMIPQRMTAGGFIRLLDEAP